MKITKHSTSLFVASGLALCALSNAFAGNDPDQHFQKMDTNGDGKISRPEHAAGAKKMFAECDANKDGSVTAAEMDASTALKGEKPGKNDKTSAEKIQEFDQNGDGKLSVAEHGAGSEKMFARMDKDGDGFLSKEECEEGQKIMKKDS